MRLFDLLPEIYKDRETEQFWDILQTAVDELELSAEELQNLLDIDKAKEEWLVNMASNLGVDLSKDFPLSNRARISKAVDLHRLTGTKEGLELIAFLINSDIRIKEWFEYGGQHHKFKVDLSPVDYEITAEFRDKVLKLITENKRLSAHLEELILSYLVKASTYITSGTMAESTAHSQMITGFEWQSEAAAFVYTGSMAEVSATTQFVEV